MICIIIYFHIICRIRAIIFGQYEFNDQELFIKHIALAIGLYIGVYNE